MEVVVNDREFIAGVDRLMREQYAVYHSAAVRCGLSDSAMWILDLVHTAETPYTQTELLRECHYPKQTIHSTVTDFVKKGIMMLEKIPGTRNRKRILLTEAGEALAEATTARLEEAEKRAASRFSEEERAQFISTLSRFNSALREEFSAEFLTSSEEQQG